ncbi:hypothetical protein QBC44DRAFT_322683 [Cladorrhinum sp. PSN332]|nr:hypothetical protein QBC44DRAFT_322683 [Cladorrhinum sp. PSN332]
METIPPEIFIDICRHLCPHCYKPALQGQDLTEIAQNLFYGDAPEWLDLMKYSFLANHYKERRCLQDSLAKLCRVSKSISRLATPILYHSLDESRGTVPGTLRFLETIGNNPELAACVRSFSPLLWNFHNHDTAMYDFFSAARKSLGLRELDLDDDDDNAAARALDGWIIGLALCAPNLEEMIINPDQMTPSYFDRQDEWKLLEEAPHHGLKSLKTLQLRHRSSRFYGRLGWDTTNKIFRAATRLETLNISNFGQVTALLPCLANLRQITITESLFDESSFRNLIRNLPRIAEFKYHSGRLLHMAEAAEEITGSELTRQLYTRRETLKRLDIDQSWASTPYPGGRRPFNSQEVMRSLTDFPVLEYLRVNVVDVIPQTEPDVQSEDADDTGRPPRRNKAGEWFVGLAPPSLKTLKVMGHCPYDQCLRVSDGKRLGKCGASLERVVFGDVKPSGHFFEPISTCDLALRKDIAWHFREEAGIPCEFAAEANRVALYYMMPEEQRLPYIEIEEDEEEEYQPKWFKELNARHSESDEEHEDIENEQEG